ncbi:hypothetical protein [Streptosporangium roseum]|uniref:hypothetical protein n=1 Tax=Streptosporangium roseum TaxID=2001 RepID=UPI00331B1696
MVVQRARGDAEQLGDRGDRVLGVGQHVTGSPQEFGGDDGGAAAGAAAGTRGRTGGRKKKLKAYQVERARQMYEQTGDDGKRTYTVQQIADEIGVKRTTLNGYLNRKTTTS